MIASPLHDDGAALHLITYRIAAAYLGSWETGVFQHITRQDYNPDQKHGFTASGAPHLFEIEFGSVNAASPSQERPIVSPEWLLHLPAVG